MPRRSRPPRPTRGRPRSGPLPPARTGSAWQSRALRSRSGSAGCVSSSMSDTASRSSAGVARSSRSVESDARMIISGFRISCAMTVDSRPSDEQPVLLRRFALEPRDRFGQRVERRRQQPRIFVVPGAARQRDLPLRSPVAATSRIAVGDGAERARHRARHAVAQDRGEQQRDDHHARPARRESC